MKTPAPQSSHFDAPTDEEMAEIQREIERLTVNKSIFQFGYLGTALLGLIGTPTLFVLFTVDTFESVFEAVLEEPVSYLVMSALGGGALNLIISIPKIIKQLRLEKHNEEYLAELLSKKDKKLAFDLALQSWRFLNEATQQGYWLQKKDIYLEHAVRDLLEKIGFEVTLTPTVGDGGIDLIATKSDEKYLIQCKGLNKPCGVATIRDAAGVQAIHGNPMIVICPRGFSSGAQKTAKQACVGLISVFELIALAKQEASLSILATGPTTIARYVKE